MAWRNKAGFYVLTSLVSSLSGGNTVLYMIMLVANEMPLHAYSELQDTEKNGEVDG